MVVKVAVVGAGASGLAAVRCLSSDPKHFSVVCFERNPSVGGTWIFDSRVGLDEFGLPIHSSMYETLRTDLPKEIMGFLDFPFPAGGRSFVRHEEVLDYLRSYADTFKLNEFIKFRRDVVSVEPSGSSNDSNRLWLVTSRNLLSGIETSETFDAVVVANGHNWKPRIPKISGLNYFRGILMHSHEYRTPTAFNGLKRAAVVGCGPSGIDICFDLSSCVDEVVLVHKSNFVPQTKLPPNVVLKCDLEAVVESGRIHFSSGEEFLVDVLIFATGYNYRFPFLSPKCGIRVDDGRVHPLYKHILNIEEPGMFFIGLLSVSLNFPCYDYQAGFIKSVLMDGLKLPAVSEMMAESDSELKKRVALGFPPHYYHKMFDFQWE